MTAGQLTLEQTLQLLQSLRVERSAARLSGILLKLTYHAEFVECGAILPFVRDRRSSIRLNAIQALGSCRSRDAEDALLNVLASPTHWSDLPCAHYALSRVGTHRAIPAVVKNLSHHKEDVKASALWTLAEIGNTDLLPVFLDALQDRSWSARSYAMRGVSRHGDERAIEPVCKRVRAILARPRKIHFSPPDSDVVEGLEFLERLRANHPEIEALMGYVKARWPLLFPGEQEWIRNHISGFAELI
jgi:hypothetical protein